MSQAKCSRCQESIFSNETIAVEGSHVFHADCRRPQAFSYEERVLLFRHCWDHPVAECARCVRPLRQEELASDFLGTKTHLCPQCHADLTESIRTHLYACTMLPAQVRERAVAAREAARVVAPVHDALLVEAPLDALDATVATAQECMRKASEVVLAGFALRSDAKVVRYPDRYHDPRGAKMWETVWAVL